MSAGLLCNPGKKHEVADDLESFIYVLCWMCLRFLEHRYTLKPEPLRSFVLSFFDMQYVREDERVEIIGGDFKLSYIQNGHQAVELKEQGTALGKLLDALALICRQHYLALNPPSVIQPTVNTAAAQPDEDIMLERSELMDEGRNWEDASPEPIGVETPAVAPALRLAEHNAVMRAFNKALVAPLEEWAPLQKTDDQFAKFEDSTFHQSSLAQSSQQSSSLKRRSDGDPPADAGEPRPPKRPRRRATRSHASQGPGLDSVQEEAGATDTEAAE